MSRKIIVASPATNKAKKVEDFNGSTWGELKNHAVLRELMVGQVEAILSPGNVTLNRDDASLPEGDFKVFLVPTQNKAGVSESEARQIGQDITNAILTASRIASADNLRELSATLKSEIESFFNVTLNDNCPECDDVLREAKGFVRG